MKQLLIGAALVTAAALAVVAAAIAAPLDSEASRQTLTLVVKATSFTHVDNPPRNVFGQGDNVVYSGIVTGPQVKGSSTGQCVQTSKAGLEPAILFCTSTITSGRGQLVVAGAVVDGAKRNVVAVVGGTGPYRGARGQAVESYIDDESSRWSLTFETS